MTSFDARLRLLGEAGFPLAVEIDLSHEHMTVSAGDDELASWRLRDIHVVSLPDGFHVKAEGEEVILNVTDKNRFAVELGLPNAT